MRPPGKQNPAASLPQQEEREAQENLGNEAPVASKAGGAPPQNTLPENALSDEALTKEAVEEFESWLNFNRRWSQADEEEKLAELILIAIRKVKALAPSVVEGVEEKENFGGPEAPPESDEHLRQMESKLELLDPRNNPPVGFEYSCIVSQYKDTFYDGVGRAIVPDGCVLIRRVLAPDESYDLFTPTKWRKSSSVPHGLKRSDVAGASFPTPAHNAALGEPREKEDWGEKEALSATTHVLQNYHTLLPLLEAWRATEVKAAAGRLGLRDIDDQEKAEDEASDALRALRIATDSILKSTSVGASNAVLPHPVSESPSSNCVICDKQITPYDSYGVGTQPGRRYHWNCIRKEAATVAVTESPVGSTATGNT